MIGRVLHQLDSFGCHPQADSFPFGGVLRWSTAPAAGHPAVAEEHPQAKRRLEGGTRRIGLACATGFTFIEILATMMLLGIVLPSVMNGISICLNTAGLARRQAEASSLCHSKLLELAAQSDVQHANLSGDFGTDLPDYRWSAQVTDFDNTTLRNLEVTVSWRQGRKDRGVTMATLVYPGGSP